MPAQGLYAEKATDTDAATTTWVDVCEIGAASFTASKQYLIIANALVTSSSGATEVRLRLVHGGTPTEFTDASVAVEVSNVHGQGVAMGWLLTFTQPGTAELVKLQISNSATATSRCQLGQIFALKLSDDFTENTDWFFAEVLTDYTTTASLADCDSTEAASVTFTPNGTDDWLIAGDFVLTPAAATSNYQGSLFDSVEGLDQPMADVEGEDATNENRRHLLARVFTPSNASHTFQLRFSHEAAAHTIKSSRIFAFNLNKLAQHSFAYASAQEAPAATPSWTTTRTVAPNPTTTGDWFMLGYFDNDVGAATDSLATRLQSNPSGGGLASNPNYGDDMPLDDGSWDNTDVIPFSIFKLASLTSGAARDINLDVQMITGTTLRVQNRCLVAFSMELAGGGPVQQSLSGSLSFASGLLVRQTGKSVSGSLSLSGDILRLGSHALAASLNFTGVSLKQVRFNLTGILSFSGLLVIFKSFNKAVEGVLSFSGGLLRQTGKQGSGSLTFSGNLQRSINLSLAGVLSFTGLLSTTKVFMKALYGILFLNRKVADDFNRDDSTDLGANWSEDYGNWQIVGQKLELATMGGTTWWKTRWTNSPISNTDHVVQATVVPTNVNDFIGVVARIDTSTNTLDRQGYGLFVDGVDGGNFRLYYFVPGTSNPLSVGAMTINMGTPYVLRLEVSGTRIRGYVDDVLKADVTDTNVASGTVGVVYREVASGHSSPNGSYDNWSAYNLADDSLVIRVGKQAVGSLPFVGDLRHSINHGLAGTLSFVGVLIKSIPRTLSGSLSFSGALQTTKTFLKNVAGALSFSGALLKQTSKPLSASLSFIGNLIRRTFKLLSGSLSFVGTLTALKAFLKSVSGTLTFSGALVKNIRLSPTGILTFVGSLIRRTSTSKSGNLSFVGSLTRQIGKILSGGLSFSGALQAVKAFLKALTGTLTFGGALVKETRLPLSGFLTFLGTLTKRTSISKSGGLTFGGSLLKRTSKLLSSSLSFAGALVSELGVQQFQQAVGGALTFIGTLRRATFHRGLTGTISFIGSLVRSTSHHLVGTLTFSSALTALRITLKAVGGVLSFSGLLVTFPRKNLAGTLSSSGSLVKAINRSLSGVLVFVGNLISQFQPIVFVSVIGTVSTASLVDSYVTSTNFAGGVVSAIGFSDSPVSSLEFE